MLNSTNLIKLVNNGDEAVKLSTRGRYGTMALLDLSLHWGPTPVPLKDVARRRNISLHYLEHLIAPLIGAGILGSVRGAKGGVQLLRPPQEVKLSEVIPLLEGSTAFVECLDNPESCPSYDLCVTRDIWDEMKKAIDGVLESTTLQDLVERQKEREQPTKSMYYI